MMIIMEMVMVIKGGRRKVEEDSGGRVKEILCLSPPSAASITSLMKSWL